MKELISFVEGLAQANLLSHPRLIDARSANLELTSADIRRLADITKQILNGLKPTPVAFVTDRNSLFGMARMYQIIAHDIHPGFSVFRDYEEAERWIRSQENLRAQNIQPA